MSLESAVTVSVIVPVYNGEAYLNQCLESLASQTLRNAEFICVDDGSSDSSAAIVEQWASRDRRFSLISKQNSGYGHSMNVGIDAARGKYVTSVDSDDLLKETALEQMASAAEASGLEFLKANRVFFQGSGPDSKAKVNRIGSNPQGYEKVFNPSLNPSLWMVKTGLPGLYLRSFLSDCSIRLNETPGASFQDTGLTAQALFNAHRAKLLDEAVYYVRVDNAGRSTLDKSKVYCICEEHDFIREKAESSRGDVGACLKSAAAMRFDGYLWNLQRISHEDKEPFVERAHEEFTALDLAGELDELYFSPKKWVSVQLLLRRPMEFYARQTYGRKLKKAERKAADARSKLSEIEHSIGYKIGKAVTWIPGGIKTAVHQKYL